MVAQPYLYLRLVHLRVLISRPSLKLKTREYPNTYHISGTVHMETEMIVCPRRLSIWSTPTGVGFHLLRLIREQRLFSISLPLSLLRR